MQNGDKGLPSIILGGRCILVKILITVTSHGIFNQIVSYLYILTLSKHNHAKRCLFYYKSQNKGDNSRTLYNVCNIRCTTYMNYLPCCKDICYFVV